MYYLLFFCYSEEISISMFTIFLRIQGSQTISGSRREPVPHEGHIKAVPCPPDLWLGSFVVNTFAPKNTNFFYPAMMARLCVATLHFNENGRRHQATTGAGAAQWYVSYPKGKKEQAAVVKPHKTPISYAYVEELRINLMERRRQFTSCPLAAAEADTIIGYKPPPLTSSYVPINKEELIAMRRSRFAN